jgi:hypothetical protein
MSQESEKFPLHFISLGQQSSVKVYRLNVLIRQRSFSEKYSAVLLKSGILEIHVLFGIVLHIAFPVLQTCGLTCAMQEVSSMPSTSRIP